MLYLTLLIHWLADFCLQTEQQANNKYNSVLALFSHCVTYGAVMTAFFWFTFKVPQFGLFIGALTLVSHFIVDFCTSKLTHKLYNEKRYHDFFVVIGADQLIHVSLLMWMTSFGAYQI